MSEPNSPEHSQPSAAGGDASPDHAACLRTQVGVVRRAFEDRVAAAATGGAGLAQDDADTAYLFRPGHALVRADRLHDVDDYLADRSDLFAGTTTPVGQPVDGLILVELPGRRDGHDRVLRTLDDIDRAHQTEHGVSPIATPDHVLYVCYTSKLCPATEPAAPPATGPVPFAHDDPCAGEGVRVSVVDTGLWPDATTSATTPWLAGVVADPADVEVIDPTDIHPYGGHGTFVAGVVRCQAPGAHIQVQGALTHGGAVYESEIVAQLDQALNEPDHPQLISISAGTHTRNDFALLSFEMLRERHGIDGVNTLVIAAAGNDSSDKPFWPAAFEWVVGVGSVDPSAAVSDYSNVGPWVDVYALGRDHVNAFPVGTYTCYEPPNIGQVRQFAGMAQWSGTSFSTPVVTGLIAAEMTRSGTDPVTAYQAILGAGAATTDPRGGNIRIVGPLS